MNKFGTKVTNKKNFMIHILNSVIEEYNVILAGLENPLGLTRPDE